MSLKEFGRSISAPGDIAVLSPPSGWCLGPPPVAGAMAAEAGMMLAAAHRHPRRIHRAPPQLGLA